jgi:F-type H+-transporting ATPase subunit alpha
MAVEQQIMIIYAVTNGLLDDVDVKEIRAWEKGFHAFMKAQHPEIGDEIRTKKALGDELQGRLKKAIDQYKAVGAR